MAFDPSAFSLDAFDTASFDLGATEVVDVRVSFVSFDTNATPCDVKVSWLAVDTQAVPCDVRVSWLAFDSQSNPEPIPTPAPTGSFGAFMRSITPSINRNRRKRDEEALLMAGIL